MKDKIWVGALKDPSPGVTAYVFGKYVEEDEGKTMVTLRNVIRGIEVPMAPGNHQFYLYPDHLFIGSNSCKFNFDDFLTHGFLDPENDFDKKQIASYETLLTKIRAERMGLQMPGNQQPPLRSVLNGGNKNE